MQKCYQNDAIFASKSVEGLWRLFIEIWATVYCGLLDTLRIDGEPSFIASSFKYAAEACGVVIQASYFEGHDAIGFGGRYHAPLTRVYLAVRLYDASLPPEMSLRPTLKAINDTMVPNGLVPISLVYGRHPLFSGHEKYPTQTERTSTVASAIAEATRAASEARINRALRSKIPPPATC